ncbi:quillaic acid 3-O-glycosyltransferase CSL1-like [Bidens hawaiensis]|uniref:quillaic acid 3-O-glycosyltransferase CSL1-like n=1 Tax=Bidens hawaiensis TaxID=980011 RepID=UPI004049F64C
MAAAGVSNRHATTTISLNTCFVQQPQATAQRIHILFHLTAILAILYYRVTNLFGGDVPTLAWALITTAEVIFSFIWFLTQAFRWRPVARSVVLRNLPDDNKLPGVDVFICTADPSKEPTVEVMNTVLSAMGLDYPPDKLAVYLSDDGGAPSTLYAMKEACSFAKSWLPFCRKYGIKSRCPEWFFSTYGHDELLFRTDEFEADEEKMKVAYEQFKENIDRRTNGASSINDRPPCVEIIHDNQKRSNEDDQVEMPLLVYVSREKRPSLPHRFKAGALNTLLRVSGVLSNAPYMLVLDCDMYCNEPSSAKQAMCFHLDPKLSSSLAFVQYPQIFYNVSQKDIYDGQARSAYKTKYQGMDGIGGTVCSGTGYYLKKQALYGSPNQQDEHLLHPKESFGESTKFIDSLRHRENEEETDRSTTTILEELKKLASCSYEDNTTWGKHIGYSYESLLESSFTGYLLHTRGWKSVYLYPKRPCFLGSTTIDMKDAMVQLMKWSSGLLQVGLSWFNPLVYGMARMSILQSMCYAYFMFTPFLAIAFLLYGIIPPLCLLNGVSLYPTASNPWFKVFAAVYVSSLVQHLYEVVSSGGSLATWWNEQRIYFIKCVSALLFGCLDVMMKSFGVVKANFRLTNKVVDREKLERYENGKFDLEGAKMFMIPLTIMVLLNVVCFVVGVKRVISNNNLDEMFAQVFMSWTTLLFSYPILKGLVPNKTKSKKIKNN